MAETTTHIGRNISRLRELRGMKQDALADALGISQQSVSKLEQSEHVDDTLLNSVAKALGFPPAAIKNFSEEAVINNIQNNYEGSNNQGTNVNHQCTFNPLDEVKRLNAEKDELYKALLKEKDDKIALVEQLLKEREEKIALLEQSLKKK